MTDPATVSPDVPAPATAAPAPPRAPAAEQWLWAVAAVAAVGLGSSVLLWQKLSNIQEQLARQSADSGAQSAQALLLARQAQESTVEAAAKLAVLDARLSEVSLQRTQLDELMQSLSRSRDENLVVDIESAVRLGLQQSQLTGSTEPLLATLKTAEARIARAAQPRLNPVQRAIERDLARIKATVLADTPTLLVKLDELVLLTDDLALANAVQPARSAEPLKRRTEEPVSDWWLRLGQQVREEVQGLLRVRKLDNPEAALLTPEQSFFVRENLKLKLLNARLGLLSRQVDSARADLASAGALINRYFDTHARKTQTTQALLLQVQGQLKALVLPRIDDTLTALTTAASGR